MVRKGHSGAVASAVVLALLFQPLGSVPASAAALPPGFQESVVFSGLVAPTNVQFASDGRVFVAEKRGTIKVFDSLSDTSPDTFADLRTNVHDFWDRGLLGLALDPSFPANPYVYVLYAYDHILGDTSAAPRWGDTCPSPPGATADGCVVSGRLSRLQAAGNSMVGPEQVLIEDWCQQYPSHSTGSMVFGPDGSLYVSGGDGASFNFADYGQGGGTSGSPIPKNPCGDPPGGTGGTMTAPLAEGGALRSQDVRTTGDPTTLDGALLRVDPATGLGMAGNPFASSSDANARRIVAYGMRNPFRITARPGTPEIWVSDVGWSTWEELNRIVAPADGVADNLGWPCYEGVGRQASYDNLNLGLCESLYSAGGVLPPYYTYRHTDSIVSGEACANGQGSSTVGMAFYNGGSYPTAYDGALFFADYSRDCLWVMTRGTNGLPDPTKRANFLTPAANPVDIKIGPGGDLFYVDINGGTIRRIQYFATNLPPTSVATGSPTVGPAPLTVSFDGSASTDADGDAVTYSWDLNGDSTFGDATSVAPTFTYATPGTYEAVLRVLDSRGASSLSPPVTISVGTLPVPVIDTPSSGLTWAVGDDITFTGHATDAEDGDLPATSLSWQVVLLHCTSQGCHEHDREVAIGAGGALDAPDHPWPSHLELRLTATDSHGLTATTTMELHPKSVQLSFATHPSGLQIAIGGTAFAAPLTQTFIQGSVNSVSAASPQDLGGVRYQFQGWADGGPNARTVVAGPSPTTYTATFVPISADLGVTQSATSGGSKATFTITTRNYGPVAATGTTLVETLPTKFTFVSATGCSYASATRRITCDLGSLANQAVATTTIVVSYKGKATVDNVVSVSSSTPDIVTPNNTSRLSVKLK